MKTLLIKPIGNLLTKRYLSFLICAIIFIVLFCILFFLPRFDSAPVSQVDKKIDVTYSDEVIVSKGDSLLKLIYKQNLSQDEKFRLTKFLSKAAISHKLHIGQKITFLSD